MLKTLLESTANRTRTSHFMVASATVHAAIVFAAVYATALGAAAEGKPDEPVVIHWVPIPKPIAPVFPSDPRRPPPAMHAGLTRVSPGFSVEVPTSLPSIEVRLAPVTSDFVPTATVDTGSITESTSVPTGGEGRHAYDITEVETGVSMIGGTIPEYPPAMRASGIDGTVAADFVVRESGRVDVSSLRIITATNDAFVESIRRALPRMRFRPATIGGRAVAQLVQQQFVFRLDR